MLRPPRTDEAGGIYHALNRGNSRAYIFHKEADFERCLTNTTSKAYGTQINAMFRIRMLRMVRATTVVVLFQVACASIGCNVQVNRSDKLRSPALLEFRCTSREPSTETTPFPLFKGSGAIDVFQERIIAGGNVERVELEYPDDRTFDRASLIFHLDRKAVKNLQMAKEDSMQNNLAIIFDGKIVASTAMPETITRHLRLETNSDRASEIFEALTSD